MLTARRVNSQQSANFISKRAREIAGVNRRPEQRLLTADPAGRGPLGRLPELREYACRPTVCQKSFGSLLAKFHLQFLTPRHNI